MLFNMLMTVTAQNSDDAWVDDTAEKYRFRTSMLIEALTLKVFLNPFSGTTKAKVLVLQINSLFAK
jgi:hypothetical protein